VAVRLVAFGLDGTLIRGRNALEVLGDAFGRPEWADRMDILSMRGETSEQMRTGWARGGPSRGPSGVARCPPCASPPERMRPSGSCTSEG
jgi:hypothetical protein